MGKLKKVVLVVVSLITILLVAIVVIFSQMDEPVIFEVEDVNFAKLGDGSCLGQANNSLIEVEVLVSILDGEVNEIEILSHSNLLGGSAEAVVDDIIAQQSLLVDTISSATYSSSTILKAVENALLECRVNER